MALYWPTILDTPKQLAPSRVRVRSEVAPTILSSTHAIRDNAHITGIYRALTSQSM